ncbi:putative iron-regulated membrane protein [Rheinheimera pacifica]|uniref:PepSY-associated TM helix domain-containing protein n=1 Tax=Rheinheimera pacifica TaxID=173990 RepID=UPI0028621D07|nr:PepSY-associated TM helix domain-containing protein [Rheinheimera pacifica]MDR6982193.1 putative iron-regulated membrane protein [Rheinheimera pacifica]
MTNRQWFALHSWAGFVLGALLLLVCVTGVLAALSYEIQYLSDSKYRALSSRSGPVNWAQLEQNLAAAYPDSQLISVQVHQQTYLAGEASLATPDGFRFAYFDPASGSLTGSGDWGRLSRFLRNLHMYLSVEGVGKVVVTSLSFLLLISLVSSFFVYRNWWRQWLHNPGKWRWAVRSSWASWHKLIGLWSWWFVLLMMLTGLWYFAEHWLLKTPLQYYPPVPRAILSTAAPTQPLSLTEITSIAQQHRPQLDIRAVLYNSNAKAPIVVSGQAGDLLLRDRANRIYLDSAGVVIGTQHTADLGLLAYLTDMADPLHFGNFSSLAVKLIYALFGTGLCILVAGGMRMHWLRSKHKQPSLARWLGLSGWLVLLVALSGIVWTSATFSQRELSKPPLSPLLGTLAGTQPSCSSVAAAC